GGSRIVNVSSVSGRIPTPGEAFYSACKAAVVSLSEALAAELASRGIGVTVVLPGEMSTALFAEHPSWERRPDFQRRMDIPPERVADAIARALRKDRFEVVEPASMRAALLVQRAAPRLFRRGVARYWPALVKGGLEVLVETGAGEGAFHTDAAFEKAGVRIVPDASTLYGQADVVLKVQRPALAEVDRLREGAVLVSFLQALTSPDLVERL